jgi:hypothetical protein
MKLFSTPFARHLAALTVSGCFSILPIFQPAALADDQESKAKPDAPVAISRKDLEIYLRVKALLDKTPQESLKNMEASTPEPPKSAYSVAEVKSYEAAFADAGSRKTLKELQEMSGYQGPKVFPWVHLRRAYTDILAGEDPTLQVKGDKGFDDLDGALFNYTRDLQSKTDTWTTQLALIAPFSYATGNVLHTGEPLTLSRYGFTPSYSLNRLSTNGDPKGEIEQHTFRLGGFLKFESGNPWLEKLTFRADAAYAYDGIKDTSVPAAEFDIEPQSDFASWARIGYRTILIGKNDPEHIHDTAILAYQFRTILHGEYGAVHKEGPNFSGSEYNFFRLGPKLELDLKPLFFSNLSAKIGWQYHPALSGQNDHDSLFTASLSWDLLKDEENRRKLSLTVSYLDGGLELTSEKARTLQVGIGATF